jgi:hypothetical protein
MKLHCDYKKIALWLQKIALLFGINCTEINQSQSSNIISVYYYYMLKQPEKKIKLYSFINKSENIFFHDSGIFPS